MKISPDGLQFIKDAEGCKLAAYLDSVGVPTIGFGHTSGVHGGMTITQAQADAFLDEDLERVYACIRASVEVPLSQGQFDAISSWVFNLGCGRLNASTLLRKLNAGDYAGAEAEFGRWVYAGQQKLAGLVKRRAGEAEMFSEVA